jgi:NTP pyrophosphatase (non-canonical NTP hydrolase)
MTETELLLCCLSEECAEVAQRVSKALRFGLEEVQPGQPKDNATRILDELNDLLAVAYMLEGRGIGRMGRTATIEAKQNKVRAYLEYSMGRAPHPHAIGTSTERSDG